MKFGAMKTWMIAGVIALAGGTTAFVALDVTGTNNGPTPFVAQSDPVETFVDNTPADGPLAAASDLDELFVEDAADTVAEAETAADALVEVAEVVVDAAADTSIASAEGAVQANNNVAVSAPANGGDNDTRSYLRSSVDAVTANLLGLSEDELAAARDGGQSTGDLLTAAGLSREDHQAAVADAWPDIVQTGVDAGVISGEEAADLLEEGPRVRNGNGNNQEDQNDGDGNRPERDGRGRGRGNGGNGGNNQGNPPGGNA